VAISSASKKIARRIYLFIEPQDFGVHLSDLKDPDLLESLKNLRAILAAFRQELQRRRSASHDVLSDLCGHFIGEETLVSLEPKPENETEDLSKEEVEPQSSEIASMRSFWRQPSPSSRWRQIRTNCLHLCFF